MLAVGCAVLSLLPSLPSLVLLAYKMSVKTKPSTTIKDNKDTTSHKTKKRTANRQATEPVQRKRPCRRVTFPPGHRDYENLLNPQVSSSSPTFPPIPLGIAPASSPVLPLALALPLALPLTWSLTRPPQVLPAAPLTTPFTTPLATSITKPLFPQFEPTCLLTLPSTQTSFQCSPDLQTSISVLPKCFPCQDSLLHRNTHGMTLLCVADGVGGYKDDHIDSAYYSSSLMNYLSCAWAVSAKLFSELPPHLFDRPELVFNLLRSAHVKLTATPGAMGGTTASLVLIKDRRLLGCNIGDSGFMIVRRIMVGLETGEDIKQPSLKRLLPMWKIIYRSKRAHTAFNASDHLSYVDSEPVTLKRVQLYSHDICAGDIVIVATDGFYDNVFDDSAMEMISTIMEDPTVNPASKPKLISMALSEFAHRESQTTSGKTPFSLMNWGWSKVTPNLPLYQGGKPDDIAVVVTIIV